jgi:hypothetical protein
MESLEFKMRLCGTSAKPIPVWFRTSRGADLYQLRLIETPTLQNKKTFPSQPEYGELSDGRNSYFS